MTAIAARRKRRTIVAIALGVVGAITVPVSLALSSYSLLNSKDGNEIDVSNVMKIPATPEAMLAVTNADGQLASINVLALAPGGKGGTVMLLPVGALADLTDNAAARRVGDAFATGGLKALTTEVEGLLDISLSLTAVVNPAKASALFDRFAPVTVDLLRPVTDTVFGNESVVVPAGESKLTADQMAMMLSSMRDNQPEQVRFERSLALWNAIATEVGDGVKPDGELEPLNIDSEPTTFKGFFDRLVAGPLQVYQFNAVPITEPARNPSGVDLYDIEPAEIIMVIASALPSAATTPSPGLTFEVDTPFADPAVVKNAVAVITFWGGSVVLVREVPGPAKVETSALYSDSLIKKDIKGFIPVVGPIAMTKSEEGRVTGIDVRLTLGQNFVDFLADPTKFGEKPASSSTTSTTIAG